jgi:2-oxoglutarate dehydrogenase complex dehydrogenase (E1) component-like enzyme
VRNHGHRAAHIDPLDLIDREETEALNPRRYGLDDDTKEYNINGIVFVGPFKTPRQDVNETWTLRRIREHLRSIYVGRIAYEVWWRHHSLLCTHAESLAVHAYLGGRTSMVFPSPRS